MIRKLLVADDSITIHKVVTLAFAGDDVAIQTAMDGPQAIEKARNWHPDLILADALLPGRTGYDLCAWVKQDTELKGTPVVLMVGTFEPFDDEEAKRVCCDAKIVKPFDTRELVQMATTLWSSSSRMQCPEGSSAQKTLTESAKKVAEPASSGSLVSSRTKESFLGKKRILNLFGAAEQATAGDAVALAPKPQTVAAREKQAVLPPSPAAQQQALIPAQASPTTDIAKPAEPVITDEIPEKLINEIVERVIRRMSSDVVREIAWEVIPELAEIVIRQHIKEQGLPK